MVCGCHVLPSDEDTSKRMSSSMQPHVSAVGAKPTRCYSSLTLQGATFALEPLPHRPPISLHVKQRLQWATRELQQRHSFQNMADSLKQALIKYKNVSELPTTALNTRIKPPNDVLRDTHEEIMCATSHFGVLFKWITLYNVFTTITAMSSRMHRSGIWWYLVFCYKNSGIYLKIYMLRP